MKASRGLWVAAGFLALFGIGVAISSARILKAEPPKPQPPIPEAATPVPPAVPSSPEPELPQPAPANTERPAIPDLPPNPPAASELPLPMPTTVAPAPPAELPQTKQRLRLAPVVLPGSDQVALPARPVSEGASISRAERDPEENVKDFLTHNQQVADRELAELKKEAESLKTRLQKVEAAIRRWEAVAQALKLNQEGVTEVLGSPIVDLPPAASPVNLEPLPKAKINTPAANTSSPPTSPSSPPTTKPAAPSPSTPAASSPPPVRET